MAVFALIVADLKACMPAAARWGILPARDQQLPGVLPGSEVSPVHLFENINIQSLISDDLFQPRVLFL